jgi:Tfp pilus assembly protein PilO
MVMLKNQIRLCARAQSWLAGAMLVIAGGFFVMGYRPSMQKMAALDEQMRIRQRELGDTSSKAGALPQVASEVKVLRLKLEGAKRLPKLNDRAQFIRDITQLSQQSSLKKFQLKPEPLQRNDLYYQQPVKLTFEGDFVNVFSFLRQTETMQRLTRTKSISLSTKDNESKNNGTVKAELVMSIYLSPDE